MRHLRTFFVCIIFIAFGSGVYAQGTWTTYKPFGEEGYNYFNAIAVGLNGDVWVGREGFVARLDGETWTTFTEDNSPVSNRVYSITIGSDGIVWVGGEVGVYRIDGGVWTTFTEDDGLVAVGEDLGMAVRDIAIGPDGTVWACGWDEWIYMYYDGIWIPSTPDNETTFTSLHFDEIAVDHDGVVWLTAGRYRVYMYYDGLWVNFYELLNSFLSITIDSDGMIWAGGKYGRIIQFNGEMWTTILEVDNEAGQLNDALNSSKSGLNSIINKEQDYYSAHGEYVDFAFGEDCEPIGFQALPIGWGDFEYSFQDSVAIAREIEDINQDGDIADGLTLSVSNVQGSIEGSDLTWTPIFDEGPKGYDINSIASEPGGALWFGADNGLHRYYDGTWTSYTTEDGLAYNNVQDVAIAPDGTVWAATLGGISKFVPSTTIVEENKDTPSEFAVIGNFPNPFNPETNIQFTLTEDAVVNLSVYNIMGQKVRELVADRMQAGTHSVVWDGRDDNGAAVSSGVYISRLKMGEHVATQTMIHIK